jgi:hypothetical protein
MYRAPMPKAAVDKYRDLHFRKYEIRLSENARSAPPACNAVGAKYGDQTQFGRAIPGAFHPRHDFRAFPGSEDVRHLFDVAGCSGSFGDMVRFPFRNVQRLRDFARMTLDEDRRKRVANHESHGLFALVGRKAVAARE